MCCYPPEQASHGSGQLLLDKARHQALSMARFFLFLRCSEQAVTNSES